MNIHEGFKSRPLTQYQILDLLSIIQLKWKTAIHVKGVKKVRSEIQLLLF